MDDPQLDQRLHKQALTGLSRINWLTRTHRLVWRPIESYCRENQLDSVAVLDLGCGSGDLLVWLKTKAQAAQIDLKITGCDMSPVALESARHRADQAKMDADFLQMNVLDEILPTNHDIVICSLFLHHLADGDVVHLLRRMAESARHLVVAADLHRGRWAHLMCWAGTRLITRSPVVHVDGPRSVEGAFTLVEIKQLVKQAGLTKYQIARHWPERFVLTWKKPSP